MNRYHLFIICVLCTWLGGTQAATLPTLRDKIGQMLLLGFDDMRVTKQSPIVKAIKDDNLGGVILYDFNYNTNTFNRNIHDPAQVKTLNRQLQDDASLGNKQHHRPQLPLIIAVDYEGGYVSRLAERYGFPPTLSAKRFATLDKAKEKKEATQMANTLKQNGFNLNFAPVLDLNVNPKSSIIGKLDRSYGADPKKVSESTKVFSRAHHQAHIITVCKHYPGHGSAKNDSHLGFVDVTDTWQKKELEPFKAGAKDKDMCPAIMTAHIVNKRLDPSGKPATLSKTMLVKLLRQQLGFKGVIISDDMQMKAISDHYQMEEAIVEAINAGGDMLIFSNHTTKNTLSANVIIDLIERNVKKGKIKRARIDDAYRRIVQLKQGLLSN